MKRLFIGFIIIICSMIVPVSVPAASGFSERLLLGKLQSDSSDSICFPRVSSGLKNEIYVVWSDKDKDDAFSISFTRSSDGGLSFEEKREIYVNTDKDVDTSPPQIGVDSEGTIYIVYSTLDFKNSKFIFSLILRKSENGGDTFDTQTLFTREGGFGIGIVYGSDIKITGNGIYYVWGGYREIYLARILEGGNNVEIIEIEEGQSPIGEFTIKQKMMPSLAIDYNNNIFVAWYEAHIEEDTVTPLFDLYMAKLENEQNVFTESKMIAKCDSFGGFVMQPSIVVTLSNTIFIIWNKASGGFETNITQPLYNMFSNDEGATFSEPLEITFGENGVVQNHGVTIDQNDVMHFIYYLNSDGMLYYSKSSDSCNSFEKGLKIEYMSFWSHMCLNERDNRVYVVWHAEEAEQHGVYFSRSVEETDDPTPSNPSGSGGGGGGGCFIHSLLD